MISRSTRRGLLATLTAAMVIVGLALAQALRDTTPPSLWVETPARVAAGERFELRISASEPSEVTVTYGGASIERVDQELQLALTAVPGALPLRIVASDAAGNVGETTRTVTGVVVPRAVLEAPGTLRPGDAYSAAVRFSPERAAPDEVALVGGPEGDRPGLITWPDAGGAYAIGAVPLGTDPGRFRIEARWRDGLDRDAVTAREVAIVPLGQEVEQLALSAATLSVITPEGRALEEQALASAEADPTQPPSWSEPFLAPIEGRGTSGFGSPRRYAPGGPVSFHEGEDIAAPTGTPIRATNAGTVVLAGHYPIKGGLTIVDHGAGVTSRYYHQETILVGAGERVARGEVIGTVGSTGLSTGPHLHWEMRVAGVATHPVGWVGTLRP